MKDSEIIELYWSRNEAAISATVHTYGNYCHAIAYNILQSHEDAEECVSDTYWSAWKSIPPHKPANLSTFLGKITRNHALNRWKMQHVQKRSGTQTALALEELNDCISDTSGIEQVLDEKELVRGIEQFLYAQNKTERNIFIGRYWHLYSIADLAKAYKMSQSKVASLLFRMRKKLKVYLEQEGIML